LQLTDEEIEEMQKQIDAEPQPVQMGPDGQPLDQGQDQQQATPEQYAPVDNVSDKGSNESETPELDKQVEKFSKVINMK